MWVVSVLQPFFVLVCNIICIFFTVSLKMTAKNRWKADLTLSARNCNRVVKARYGKIRRRFRIEEHEVKFSALVNILRDKFDLPLAAELILNYADKDGDRILMANDMDLKDAIVTQALNPLRLYVAFTENCQNNKTCGTFLNGDRSHIIKAKFRNSLRRLRISPNVINFSQLQSRIRHAFELTPTVQMKIKYVDNYGDVVTMSTNEDLTDALVLQSLNPLRLNISVVENRGDNLSRDSYYNLENNDTESVVHHGVICEGCESPLKGPRFKSRKIFCYDLCQKCFIASGANWADFVMLEKSFYDADVQQTSPTMEPTNRQDENIQDLGDSSNMHIAGETSESKDTNRQDENIQDLGDSSNMHIAGETSESKDDQRNADEDPPWTDLLHHHYRDSISGWVVDQFL